MTHEIDVRGGRRSCSQVSACSLLRLARHTGALEKLRSSFEECFDLPTAVAHFVPTLEERMDAAKEKQSRIVRLQETVLRQARDDQWTSRDWGDFLTRFEDEPYGTDLDDEGIWADVEDPSSAETLTWEVQQEGDRPQAALMRGRISVLSTFGLAHTEKVEELIQWCRTDAVTKAPIERA